MNLTQSQQDAVNHGDSNLQLIACAGSGKTEVIARRVAHLIKNGLRPSNIIAFTFTEKAAAELKERIVSRVREELGEIHGMAEMYIGTIHAFCLDLLTAEVPKYLKFDVLNPRLFAVHPKYLVGLSSDGREIRVDHADTTGIGDRHVQEPEPGCRLEFEKFTHRRIKRLGHRRIPFGRKSKCRLEHWRWRLNPLQTALA